MKLIEAHATNYRNIIDSNPVRIGQSTCLVGKNEAGKSAFLKALEGLRPANRAFKQYGRVENYPRRHLADYDTKHSTSPAKVMSTIWEMDDDDVAAIEGELTQYSGLLSNAGRTSSGTPKRAQNRLCCFTT
jgi:ATPase subunit of ABC transporter with duplicated ATPase domains